MNVGRGLLFALGASLALGACASAGTPASGPAAAPSGRQYAPGIQPKNTKFSQTAQLFLAQASSAGEDSARARGFYQQALDQAQQGIESDTTNAQHYLLAGSAHAGLGDFEEADRMWDRAEQLYPAYAEETDPAREAAWARAFNLGIAAYNAGNMSAAAEAWQQANQIYDKRPEAYINLAIIQTQEDQNDQAIATYRAALAALEREPLRTLTPEEQQERTESRATVQTALAQLLTETEQFAEAEAILRQIAQQDLTNVEAQANLASALARQNKNAEANAIYDRLLSQPNLGATELFNVGVGLFNAKAYARSAEAFRRVAELQPTNRDAWYNLVNALYAEKRNADIIAPATRLLEMDPLNENVSAILARAYNETKQTQRAQQMVDRLVKMPVYVDDLQLRNAQGKATLSGTVRGNQARAGSPVRLQVKFYGAQGEVGTQTVTVNAPAKDASARFEATLETPGAVTGYSYSVL